MNFLSEKVTFHLAMADEADQLFQELDKLLEKEVDAKYFTDPKIYRSLIDVVEIVNTSTSFIPFYILYCFFSTSDLTPYSYGLESEQQYRSLNFPFK